MRAMASAASPRGPGVAAMNVSECFIVAVVKHFQKRGIEELLFRINRCFVNSDGLEVRDHPHCWCDARGHRLSRV